MNILIINEVLGHTSTGKICAEIAEKFESEGHSVKVAYGRDDLVPDKYRKFAIRIGSDTGVKVSALQTRLFDNHGLANKNDTKRFLQWAEAFNPDLLWLHNLHGYYINYEILFTWIKKRPNMEVKWTLHDCWSFTGHCTHFTAIKCNKWMQQCAKCPQKRCYPASLLVDASESNYVRKKKAFTGVKNLSIITPSKWLADIVSQSFLNEYPIEVHYNTINKDIFKPISSDFRREYSLQSKTIILGVANVWNERKGLYDFFTLAQMLDNKYAIVMVGLTEKQINELPQKIEGLRQVNFTHTSYNATVFSSENSIDNQTSNEKSSDEKCFIESKSDGFINKNGKVVRQDVNAVYEAITGEKYIGDGQFKAHCLIAFAHTRNQIELAQLYSVADYFVNMTYEDTYPTVNLEAIACGTKVITYDTGGCAETIGDTK